MNFADSRFWELLFAALACCLIGRALVSRLAEPTQVAYDKLSLLGIGLFLLACVSWVTFVIFLVVAIGTYLGLQWVLTQPENARRKYCWALIPLQVAPLLYFKYAAFVCNGILGCDIGSLSELVIPVGISFYSFQKVAFVLDTLAFQQPLPRFLDYMNFAGFFPQIVAGPIERRKDLLPQMESFRLRWDSTAINEGAGFVALGMFFKCCLADNFATYFDPSNGTNPFVVWLANVIFGIRIYYDFAGYSLVALGIARCLGVQLTLNFASPYSSTDITEFWRRWHITLSQWFRDYIYIPMGGGRVRYWWFNLGLVFVISGVWHGAGWNFLIWGLLHGLWLILHRALDPLGKMPRPLAWMGTMAGVFVTWLCFYETRIDVLLMKLRLLAGPTNYSVAALRQTLQGWAAADIAVLGFLLLLAGATLLVEWLSIRWKNEPYYYLRRRWVLVGLILATVLLAPGRNNGFIYFAF